MRSTRVLNKAKIDLDLPVCSHFMQLYLLKSNHGVQTSAADLVKGVFIFLFFSSVKKKVRAPKISLSWIRLSLLLLFVEQKS